MRDLTYYIFTLAFIINSLCSQNVGQSYTNQTIYDIAQNTEDQIDLGLAALILAKEFFQDLDINHYLSIIDQYANIVEIFSKYSDDPEIRIRALNTFLYKQGKWNHGQHFEYDLSDMKVEKFDNQFLNRYIDTKLGSCITMPLLYAVVSQRIGWPVQMVLNGQHTLCRYVDETFDRQNIEPTTTGGFVPDSVYIITAQISQNSIDAGVYMKALSNKEYLSILININANIYNRRGNKEKALEYYELAKNINPLFPGAWWNASKTYSSMAESLEKDIKHGINTQHSSINKNQIYKYLELSKLNRDRALELGITFTFSEEFNKKLEKDIENYLKRGKKW